MDDLAAFDAEIARFQRDIQRANEEMADACKRGVELGVKAGEHEAKTNHRYKDGPNSALTKSIKGYVTRTTDLGAEGIVEATAEHASYVNDGTDPHTIEPSKKKVLAFEVKGERVFAKRVEHPGTAPDPFMDRAETKAEEVVEREVKAGLAKAAAILGG